MVVLPETEPDAAVIVAVPDESALATPEFETVATFVFEEDQLRPPFVTLELPSL